MMFNHISRAVYAIVILLQLVEALAPFDSYIYAPSSRTLRPVKVFGTNGTVDHADSLLAGATVNASQLLLKGPSASASYDFGINVGGWVSFNVTKIDAPQTVMITFTESSAWVSATTSDTSSNVSGSSECVIVIFFQLVFF
jgi:hypothetical protein